MIDLALAPGFTGSPLIRLDNERDDPTLFAAHRADPAARLLRLDGADPIEGADGGLGWDRLADAPVGVDLALLGLLDGAPCFAPLNPIPAGNARPMALWPLLERLAAGEAATYAAARSLVTWHGRHRFCANCGTATQVIRAGWARRCDGCGTDHFPRTDPVVIMLAEHDGRVLVGRQPAFPPKRYSALAGFVEVGESIEDAVARELFEEAGVRARSVRYIASQPWPFPSQLMVACVAPVIDDAIHLDGDELDHAFWATREDVAAALADDPAAPFIAPPPFAIANTLFRRWLAGA